MKYFKLIFLSMVVLGLILASTYYIDAIIDLPQLSLNTAAGISSILSSVVTLVIALILYRRFTGTQFLTDKQTTVVMGLIEFMTELRFHFILLEDGKVKIVDNKIMDTILTNIYLQDLSTEKRDISDEKYQSLKHYAEKDLLQVADKFMRLSSNIYLPRPLAQKITYHFNSRTPWWLDSADRNTERKYIKISLSTSEENSNYRSFYANYVVVDPLALSEGLVEIYEEALDWMKKNNSDIYSRLNIQKFKAEKEQN